MDSHELFKATSHLTTVLHWEDWIHVGTGNEIKIDQINEILDTFLIDEQLNFIYKRTNSGPLNRTEIWSEILSLLGTEDFQLWNQTLTRSIQFRKIGILRKGEKTSYNKRN